MPPPASAGIRAGLRSFLAWTTVRAIDSVFWKLLAQAATHLIYHALFADPVERRSR